MIAMKAIILPTFGALNPKLLKEFRLLPTFGVQVVSTKLPSRGISSGVFGELGWSPLPAPKGPRTPKNRLPLEGL